VSNIRPESIYIFRNVRNRLEAAPESNFIWSRILIGYAWISEFCAGHGMIRRIEDEY
jgi:hypothetical protein